MVDLKKDVIEKFISDKLKNLSYLNEREIGLFSLMSALAETDIYFHKIFTPLIRNYMEYKKSLRGFGITTLENLLNPYKVYSVEEIEKHRPSFEVEEKKKRGFLFFRR